MTPDLPWVVEWKHGDAWKPLAAASQRHMAEVICDYAKGSMSLTARVREVCESPPAEEAFRIAEAALETALATIRAAR